MGPGSWKLQDSHSQAISIVDLMIPGESITARAFLVGLIDELYAIRSIEHPSHSLMKMFIFVFDIAVSFPFNHGLVNSSARLLSPICDIDPSLTIIGIQPK